MRTLFALGTGAAVGWLTSFVLAFAGRPNWPVALGAGAATGYGTYRLTKAHPLLVGGAMTGGVAFIFYLAKKRKERLVAQFPKP